jgi:hypothetical protein
VFSYSVSFAVALSSRPLREIRRIWADGKLLRGENGDFKVSTEFRFYDGSEAQGFDPLIASLEGADQTPAHRGLALAVFEDLELADYGNRIPFLTFEVVADAVPLQLNAVLGDASAGLIDCDAATAIGGYAATGSTIREAITPLVESFAVDLVESGAKLRSPTAGAPVAVAEDELGCSCEGRAAARVEREQAPARSLPASLMLTYYDPQRDYQTGQARSETIGEAPTEARIELPAVLGALDARSLAEQAMARRWARKDRLTVRLPPRFAPLEPGALVELSMSPARWQVERSTIDGMVIVAELRPAWSALSALAADAGRFLPPSDVLISDLALALVELPDLTGHAGLGPTLHLAASTNAPTWKRLPVEVSGNQFLVGVRTARRKTVMGSAVTVLGDGAVEGIDTLNSVEVELIDSTQWLTSCEDDALLGGANLALLGDELIQFADAAVLSPGRFQLTRLLRGRYATDWAMATHASGDVFLLIDPASLQSIPLPISVRGTVVTASCRLADSTVTTQRLVDGRSLRTGLFIDGEQVVGRRAAAIAAPAGGATIDTEARAAVSQILEGLRQHGLIGS